MAPLVRTGGSRHTGLAAPPHRNIHDYLKTITNTAKEYVESFFRRLREHGYDSKLMKLYIVGGGGCMIRNFAEYNERRITVNDDICATAKGYERMLEMKLIKNGGAL